MQLVSPIGAVMEPACTNNLCWYLMILLVLHLCALVLYHPVVFDDDYDSCKGMGTKR